ncbi:hypothetical protein ACFWGN_10605 [Oerskovia sp. NPDC060338]|uniref:hypothetical protein n=1 Tax=Oerskovia sp. NPDC060338 TaxID=3347100 RepID=UPI003668FC30
MTSTIDRPPTPTAARIRRPTWRDPRLVLGIVLVAGSVALGSWAVSTAGRTVAVYAAAGPLTPGQTLDLGALRTVDVRLGAGEDAYFVVGEAVPEDLVALRVVGEGELVPRSAVGDPADLAVRPVAISVAGGLSDRVTDGALVDVWFVPDTSSARGAGDESSAPEPPHELVGQVVVAQVAEASSTLVTGGTTTLHVLVPTDSLPEVLGALAAEGEIAVVPVAGGAS